MNDDLPRPLPSRLPAAMAELYTDDYLLQRRRAMASMELQASFAGVDHLDSQRSSGHARGIQTSTRLTSDYRGVYRKEAMDITPQDVIDVLVGAGVKDWVLMGLHGYVGYLPQPRATQDVDVMVPFSQRKKAVKAIREKWPDLEIRELSQVVRFLDPKDLDAYGQPQQVIDLMVPWAKFQETILREFVVVDDETRHRIARLEAALVSKYAAMISPNRDREKKDYDAGDFRRMVRANFSHIDRDTLRRLAAEVWEGGADDIERFLEIAVSDSPFPV